MDLRERVAEYEAQRLRGSAQHDNELRKLLKVLPATRPVLPEDDHNSACATAAKRRAAYAAKVEADMKLRKQRISEAKQLIRQRLEHMPEGFIESVIAAATRAAKLEDTYATVVSEVTVEMVDECCEKVKGEYFKHKIEHAMNDLGALGRSSQCRDQIVATVLKRCTMEVLASATERTLIIDAVRYLLDSGSSSLSCPICMDPLVSLRRQGELDLVDVSNAWSAPLRKNEHWTNHACGHMFCRSCMETWAETAVNDQKIRIKCPGEGCTYSLMEQDLRELLSMRVFSRYQEHKHADYLQNLRQIADKDDSLMRWLRSHARPCPDCHVIVSRYEGCNVMTCVCGCRFCYACGSKSCQCSEKSKLRADIWKPDI